MAAQGPQSVVQDKFYQRLEKYRLHKLKLRYSVTRSGKTRGLLEV